MENVLISIIIPLYNQGVFIEETLDSVFASTFTNFECVVINDGSTDASEEIVLNYTRKESKIRYFFKENGGLSSARNFGIEKARGNYIMPLDADDIISPIYMEKFVEILKEFPEVDLVYGNAVFFGDLNKSWNLPKYNYSKLLFGNQIYCSSIYKKIIFFENGGYDLNMRDGFEDWDFLIRSLEGKIVKKIENTVFFYRIKKVSMMQNLSANKIKYFQTKIYIYNKNINKYKKYHPIKRYFYILKCNMMILINQIGKK